jgi:trk system potassium uptake protein
MNIIVVGCGRMGGELAYRLSQRNHQVVVIDQDPTAFNNMPADFRGRTVEGDMLSQDVWHRAGVDEADGIAVLTNSDSLNVVAGHVARTIYHVPNIIIRNYDPRWRPMQEAFGLQIIGPASWGAQRVEEMLSHADMRAIFSAGNGEVEIYEVTVPDAWNGRRLDEMLAETGCLAVAVSHAGRAALPTPNAMLEVCDVVHVSATAEGIETLRQRLAQTKEA